MVGEGAGSLSQGEAREAVRGASMGLGLRCWCAPVILRVTAR